MIPASWLLVGLAAVQVVDAALCWRPLPFIARCLRDVGLPTRWWRLLPPVKLAAAAGLVVGVRLHPVAVLTTSCLVGYFLLAVAAHLRVRDLGRNLFVNATGMLLICLATLVVTVRQGA